MAQVDPKGVTQEMLAAARSRDVLGIATAHERQAATRVFNRATQLLRHAGTTGAA